MLPLTDAISPYNVLRVQLNVYKQSEDDEKATFTTIYSSQTASAVSNHSAVDLNPVDAHTHTVKYSPDPVYRLKHMRESDLFH